MAARCHFWFQPRQLLVALALCVSANAWAVVSDTVNWTGPPYTTYYSWSCDDMLAAGTLVCDRYDPYWSAYGSKNLGGTIKGVALQNRKPVHPAYSIAVCARYSALSGDVTQCWTLAADTNTGIVTFTAISGISDQDADLIIDGYDNCPSVANTTQLNSDSDSMGNVCDDDDDNDGLADGSDNCPVHSNADQLNTDGDSQGNVCDSDDDNDGVLDASDRFPLDPAESADTDNDGIGNNADTDDDNDGALDAMDNCPLSNNADQLNADGDAQGDACDSDDDNDGVADTSDKFPLNGAASSDSDNDGAPGSWNAACDVTCQAGSGLVLDNCPTTSNANQLDTDGDAQGDVCDADDDNDGVADGSDNFPLNPAASTDSDNDGYPGSWNSACDATCQANSGLTLDNCPASSNPTQADFDGDTQGDVCDTDDDNDGAPDYVVLDFESGTIPTQPSMQMSGNAPWVIDTVNKRGNYSLASGTISHSKLSTVSVTAMTGSTVSFWLMVSSESSNDRLRFYVDGVVKGTWSGAVDWIKVSVPVTANAHTLAWEYSKNATNTVGSDKAWIDDIDVSIPLDNCYIDPNPDQLDTDGDSQGDLCDTDDDNDGVADVSDKFPLNAAASSDSDNDGAPDSWNSFCEAACPANSGLTLDNCLAYPNASQINTDGDAQGDACDADDDNDGVADAADKFPLDASRYQNPRHNADTDMDSDVLIRSTSTGTWTRYSIQSNAIVGNASMNAPAASNMAYVAQLDANGDGDADILTRNTTTGAWTLSIVENGAVTSNVGLALYANLGYVFVGTGDFNNDGTDDVLLRDATSGYRIFLLQNHAVSSSAFYNAWISADSVDQGIGDFDGDGTDDLLVRKTSDKLYYIFRTLNGAVNTHVCACNIWKNPDWTFQFAGDMNKNGIDDIIIRGTGATGDGKWWVFKMANFYSQGYNNLNLFYNKTAVSLGGWGDYNGDGTIDVLTRVNNATTYVSPINNAVVVSNTKLADCTTDQVIGR